jgi:HAD superfamily hydrolase (TIGR01509 family)
VPTYRACLVDVYDTVVSIDLPRYGGLLAEQAGVELPAFAEALAQWAEQAMDGRLSLEQTFREVLVTCGASADDGDVERLLDTDRQLVGDLAVLHDDAVPFLQSLRAQGVRTAFVSNCADNTRPLLDGLGLSTLVDELVLSCEVLAAKPDPAIFEIALDRLGVGAQETVFVDDQEAFCRAATDLGIRAVGIDRSPTRRAGTVSTLTELATYF